MQRSTDLLRSVAFNLLRPSDFDSDADPAALRARTRPAHIGAIDAFVSTGANPQASIANRSTSLAFGGLCMADMRVCLPVMRVILLPPALLLAWCAAASTERTPSDSIIPGGAHPSLSM